MEQDLKKKARLRCLHLLERRDYTEKQLREKLRAGKTEYPPEIIDDALDYVKSYHYVDDGRYARQYVACMRERKSRLQITRELYVKGVGRAEIEAAFAETEEVPEETLILKWMEKRRFQPGQADIRETQRMYAFLARKGFSGESIKSALQLLDR